MEKKHVLVVDDDLILLKTAEEILSEFYSVSVAKAGSQAIALLEKGVIPDLILLDIAMPGMDGYETLNEMKKIPAAGSVQIIFLTGFSDADYEVRGLKSGAVDYIVKPFSPSEVMARLRAVLRLISRQSVETQSGQILRVSNMEVNLDEYTFCIDGKKIPMTKKEIETMWTLASTPGKVFTRDNLLDSLWGYDYYGDSRTVDSHIKRLRAKLDSVPHPDWTIKTIWGVGYKLEIAGGQ